MDTKQCTNCSKIQPIANFTKDKQKKDGLCSHCRTCTKEMRKRYVTTLKGYLGKLINSAKIHSKARLLKGREEAGIFALRIEEVQAQWTKQNGLCFYSKIRMSTIQCSDWQCSIVRLDTNKGYIIDNIVLCCCEFNHSKQWHTDKIIKAIELSQSDFVLPNYEYEQSKRIISKAKPIERKIIDNALFIKCNKCSIFCHNTEINTNANYCKKCKREYDNLYIEKPRTHFLNLLTRAKHRSNKSKRETLTFDILYDDIVNLYIQQNGRCAYSNIPMTFGRNLDKEWLCSLERKDPLKGYTKDNICLICYEFNTADRTSSSKKENISGSCAWSKEKFQYFMNSYLVS